MRVFMPDDGNAIYVNIADAFQEPVYSLDKIDFLKSLQGDYVRGDALSQSFFIFPVEKELVDAVFASIVEKGGNDVRLDPQTVNKVVAIALIAKLNNMVELSALYKVDRKSLRTSEQSIWNAIKFAAKQLQELDGTEMKINIDLNGKGETDLRNVAFNTYLKYWIVESYQKGIQSFSGREVEYEPFVFKNEHGESIQFTGAHIKRTLVPAELQRIAGKYNVDVYDIDVSKKINREPEMGM